jgi:Ser/Thr protein kinase RdoA (MazF antagonist)
MMKLHHLYDNRDLVMHLLENWDHDAAGMHLLDRFRISANAVYPFKCLDKVRFLRFAPLEEKRQGQSEAELAFLTWLDSQGYPAGQPVPSLNSRLLEVCDTPWGLYQANVFEGVSGERLDWSELTDDIIAACGRSLARLHVLSSRYEPLPQNLPWSWEHVMEWSLEILDQIPVLPSGAYGPDSGSIPPGEYETARRAAHDEASNLMSLFHSLPAGPEFMGVIHYDFETDNLFWQNETGRCVPIDFDDIMVHWYLADIAQALESLRETVEEKMESATPSSGIHEAEALRIRQKAACDCFLAGYRDIRPISEDMLPFIHAFLRFAALYGYARIVRSISAVRADEPEWMAELRSKLHQLMKKRSRLFGSPLMVQGQLKAAEKRNVEQGC